MSTQRSHHSHLNHRFVLFSSIHPHTRRFLLSLPLLLLLLLLLSINITAISCSPTSAAVHHHHQDTSVDPHIIVTSPSSSTPAPHTDVDTAVTAAAAAAAAASASSSEPWHCFGHSSARPSSVCSGGRGVCVQRDQCVCRPPYAGERCEMTVCGGLDGSTQTHAQIMSSTRGCSPDMPAHNCSDVFSQDMPLLSGMYYVRMTTASSSSSSATEAATTTTTTLLVYCERGSTGTAMADLTLIVDTEGNTETADMDADTDTVGVGVPVVSSSSLSSSSSPDSESDSVSHHDDHELQDIIAGGGDMLTTSIESDSDDASVEAKGAAPKKKRKENNDTNNTTTSSYAKASTTSKRVTIPIPRNLLKYALQPKVISHNKIVFHNARDLRYYERTLRQPVMTVWLLTSGGTSKRRLNYSSKRIFETAWRMGIQVRIMSTFKFDIIVTERGLEDLRYDGEPIEKMPDVVMPRLGARLDYFGMSIVRHFDRMGVLVFNTHNSLDISRDKLFSIQQLAAHNFPIPKTMFVRFPVNITHIEREFTYPFVLKKSTGTHGKGVMLIRNREHIDETMSMIDRSKPMIVQEFVSHSKGRDIRIIVAGSRAIGAMMRVAKKGFRSNYHQGGYVKPVKLTPNLEWLATEAARIVGLDIAGVDLLIDKGTYRICEINASPGFQGFELATGIDVARKLLEYARLRTNMQIKASTKQALTKRKPVEVPVQVQHLTPVLPTRTKGDDKVKHDKNASGGSEQQREEKKKEEEEEETIAS